MAQLYQHLIDGITLNRLTELYQDDTDPQASALRMRFAFDYRKALEDFLAAIICGDQVIYDLEAGIQHRVLTRISDDVTRGANLKRRDDWRLIAGHRSPANITDLISDPAYEATLTPKLDSLASAVAFAPNEWRSTVCREWTIHAPEHVLEVDRADKFTKDYGINDKTHTRTRPILDQIDPSVVSKMIEWLSDCGATPNPDNHIQRADEFVRKFLHLHILIGAYYAKYGFAFEPDSERLHDVHYRDLYDCPTRQSLQLCSRQTEAALTLRQLLLPHALRKIALGSSTRDDFFVVAGQVREEQAFREFRQALLAWRSRLHLMDDERVYEGSTTELNERSRALTETEALLDTQEVTVTHVIRTAQIPLLQYQYGRSTTRSSQQPLSSMAAWAGRVVKTSRSQAQREFNQQLEHLFPGTFGRRERY